MENLKKEKDIQYPEYEYELDYCWDCAYDPDEDDEFTRLTTSTLDSAIVFKAMFFSKTHHFKGNSLLVSKRLLSLWEFLKIKN